MGEFIDFREAQLRQHFRCRICEAVQSELFSVKMSLWGHEPDLSLPFTDGIEKWSREGSFRTDFICQACLTRFHFEPMFAHGFLKHNGKTHRMSNTKKPVAYDFTRWARYIKRYRSEENY